jgi:hypothetical protein
VLATGAPSAQGMSRPCVPSCYGSAAPADQLRTCCIARHSAYGDADSVRLRALRGQAYTREHGLAVPIEVETRDLGEVREVLALLAADGAVRVDRIMLDNMARLDAGQPGARRPRRGVQESATQTCYLGSEVGACHCHGDTQFGHQKCSKVQRQPLAWLLNSSTTTPCSLPKHLTPDQSSQHCCKPLSHERPWLQEPQACPVWACCARSRSYSAHHYADQGRLAGRRMQVAWM